MSHDAHGHHELSFWEKYVFSVDHKVIGLQYLITSFIFLLFGFGLVLTSIAAWVWLGQRSREPAPQRTGDEEREAA